MARFLAHGRTPSRMAPITGIFQTGKLQQQMKASERGRRSRAIVEVPSELRMDSGLLDGTCGSVGSGTSQASAAVAASPVSGDSRGPSAKLIGKAEDAESSDPRSNHLAGDCNMMQRIRTLEELQAESLTALESVQDRWMVASAETAGWSRRLEVLEEKVSDHQRQCPGLVAVVNVGIGTSGSSSSSDPNNLASSGTGCCLCRCGSSCDTAASGTGSSVCEAAKKRREADDAQMQEILAKIRHFDKAIALLHEHLESRCQEWMVALDKGMMREKHSREAKFQQEPKASGMRMVSACQSLEGQLTSLDVSLVAEPLEDKHRSKLRLEKADTGGTDFAAKASQDSCAKDVGNTADRLRSEQGAVADPDGASSKLGEEVPRRRPSRDEVARTDSAPVGRANSRSMSDRHRTAAGTRADARTFSPGTSLAVSSSSGANLASRPCSPLSSVMDVVPAPRCGTRESSPGQVSTRFADTRPTEQPAPPAESRESAAPAGFALTEKLQAVSEDVFGEVLVPEENAKPNVVVSSESVKNHFANADRNAASCGSSSSSQQATGAWPGSGAAGRPLQPARGSSLGRGSVALAAAAREQQQQQRQPTIEPPREPLLHGRQQGEQHQKGSRPQSQGSAFRKAISPLSRSATSPFGRRNTPPRSTAASSSAEATTWRASATALTAVSDSNPAGPSAAAAAAASAASTARSAGGSSASSAHRRPPTLATSRCSPTEARKNSESVSPRLNMDVGENGNNRSF